MDIINDISVPMNGMTAAGPAASSAQPEDLETACRQFEGLLMGMILKNCMADSAGGMGEETPSGMDGFRDFCLEQVATTLSEESPLGIAEQLMAQAKAH